MTAESILDSIEGVTKTRRIGKEFIGIILLPIVGHISKEFVGIFLLGDAAGIVLIFSASRLPFDVVFLKDKLNLSIGVAVGSTMVSPV